MKYKIQKEKLYTFFQEEKANTKQRKNVTEIRSVAFPMRKGEKQNVNMKPEGAVSDPSL